MGKLIKVCNQSKLAKRIELMRKVCDGAEKFVLPMLDDEDQFISLNEICPDSNSTDEDTIFAQKIANVLLARK